MSDEAYHIPVMLQECIDGLNIHPDGTYVDVTFGGGGHSIEILKRLDKGKLFGFDQDADAQVNAIDDPKLTLIGQNFRHLKRFLRAHGVRQVDGILADLGVSSHQFNTGERGFSLRFSGKLDMRMNKLQERSAYEVVNEYSEDKLVEIFRFYGELKGSFKAAKRIVHARSEAPIETTDDLMRVLQSMAPMNKHNQFFAQVFQAIRIEVNDELKALKEMLEQCIEVLKPGGRLVVMSYHSLEDRLVKQFLRSGNFQGEQEKDFYGNLIRPFTPTQSKPIVPTESELEKNNRARSAKLRIATRNE